MFAKTYRVHRIFTHSWGGIFCKDKMLKDTKLISMVCCLLLVDALLVSMWTLMDPMQRTLKNLTIEISVTDRSVVYQPQVCFHLFLKVIKWTSFKRFYKQSLIKMKSDFLFHEFLYKWTKHMHKKWTCIQPNELCDENLIFAFTVVEGKFFLPDLNPAAFKEAAHLSYVKMGKQNLLSTNNHVWIVTQFYSSFVWKILVDRKIHLYRLYRLML